MHDNSHRQNRTHTNRTQNKSTHTPPSSTPNDLIPVRWGSTIPVTNLTANTPIPTKHRIVHVRRKDDTTKPRPIKQLCTPSLTTTSHTPFQNPNQKGHPTDNPMHRPKLNITPTNSISPVSKSASISHNNDAQHQAPKQNPQIDYQPTISPTINDHQQSANIITQQSPAHEDIHPCTNTEPSSTEPSPTTRTATTQIQNYYPTPYSRAYRYTNFCNTHDIIISPGSIWHY